MRKPHRPDRFNVICIAISIACVLTSAVAVVLNLTRDMRSPGGKMRDATRLEIEYVGSDRVAVLEGDTLAEFRLFNYFSGGLKLKLKSWTYRLTFYENGKKSVVMLLDEGSGQVSIGGIEYEPRFFYEDGGWLDIIEQAYRDNS